MTKKFTKALALVMAAICMFSLALTSSAAGYIGADAAKQAAVDAVNAKFATAYTVSTVTFEDLIYAPEYEDDYRCNIYDISFYVSNGNGTFTEYEVDIDAKTGAVKGNVTSEIEGSTPVDPTPSGNYISEAAAKQAAVDAVNAKFATSYTVEGVRFDDRRYSPEYEDDYNCHVYDISFDVDNGNGTHTEYDVDVDAVTGNVKGNISSEIDRNDFGTGSNGADNFFAQLKAMIENFINYLKALFKIA